MERNEFLKMCQSVAVLPSGTFGIKMNVPDELCVKYEGRKFYPYGYMIMFNDVNGEPMHVAILHDMDINSISHVSMAKVEGFSGCEK